MFEDLSNDPDQRVHLGEHHETIPLVWIFLMLSLF